MSTDKIAIIVWHTSDLYISKLLPQGLDKVFVLENRRWDLHTLDINDSVNLLQKHVDKLIDDDMKQIILPPVFEVYFRYLHDNKSDYNHIILPVFETFVKEQVLPYSIVGKLCLIGNPDHTKAIEQVVRSRSQSHTLTISQSNNRHFHKDWIIYHHDTAIFDSLFDLAHSRFVNKLIKIRLKKIKDRASDTLIPTNYGYLKWTKTIHGFAHKKIRFYSKDYITNILDRLIWRWSDGHWSTNILYHTWVVPNPKIYINLSIKKEDLNIIKSDIS